MLSSLLEACVLQRSVRRGEPVRQIADHFSSARCRYAPTRGREAASVPVGERRFRASGRPVRRAWQGAPSCAALLQRTNARWLQMVRCEAESRAVSFWLWALLLHIPLLRLAREG